MSKQLSLFPSEKIFPGRETEKGVEIFLKVTPKAAKTRVGEVLSTNPPMLRVYVTAAPVDDAANEAVIKLMSDFLSVPKSHIHIVRGAHHREKRLLIENYQAKDFPY